MSDEKKSLPSTPVDTAVRHGNRYPIASLPADKRTALINNVLARYLEDEEIEDIAKDLGVSNTGLYQAIIKYAPDEWVSVQGSRALLQMQMAEREMVEASDMLTVARARELIKSSQWKAERTMRRLYGDSAPKTDSGRVSIVLNVGNQHSLAQSGNNVTIDQSPTDDVNA